MKEILSIHSLKNGFNEINLRTATLSVNRYRHKIEYFMDIKPGQTIVDFGCGDGAVTSILAKTYPNSNFIGIDYSEDLINHARIHHTNSNIKYVVANIKNQETPLPNASVDKIFSWGVIYYIHPKNEYEKFQKEFLRILKETGKIIHFQIPLRYDLLHQKIDYGEHGIIEKISNFKKFLKDISSCKFNEHSYKYSKNDLLKLRSNFSSIKIIPDDFFKGRVSVVYDK